VPGRLARVLYLATLALLPWAALVPFPWLHENARWTDVLFLLATVFWAAALLREGGLPRARAVHAGLAAYLGWALVSLAAADSRPASGHAKLLGMAMLAALLVVTSDMMGRPGMPKAVGRTIAATSILAAVAAVAGVALSAFGRITPLVGTCGDLLPGPLSRAQAGFPHPNLLASYCVFAFGAVELEDAGLSRAWRRVVRVALAVTVVLTTSRAILGFALAAAIRWATTPARRRFAAALAVVLVLAMTGLTAVNVTFSPLRPWDARVLPGPSARLEAAASSFATLVAHPLVGRVCLFENVRQQCLAGRAEAVTHVIKIADRDLVEGIGMRQHELNKRNFIQLGATAIVRDLGVQPAQIGTRALQSIFVHTHADLVGAQQSKENIRGNIGVALFIFAPPTPAAVLILQTQ